MLKSVINNYYLNKAAVVVDNAITVHGIRDYGIDPALLANHLVARVWDEVPNVISGKFGKRPHKLSIAAAAAAMGVVGFQSNRDKQLACHLALGSILLELTANSHHYNLVRNDEILTEKAQDLYLRTAAD